MIASLHRLTVVDTLTQMRSRLSRNTKLTLPSGLPSIWSSRTCMRPSRVIRFSRSVPKLEMRMSPLPARASALGRVPVSRLSADRSKCGSAAGAISACAPSGSTRMTPPRASADQASRCARPGYTLGAADLGHPLDRFWIYRNPINGLGPRASRRRVIGRPSGGLCTKRVGDAANILRAEACDRTHHKVAILQKAVVMHAIARGRARADHVP